MMRLLRADEISNALDAHGEAFMFSAVEPLFESEPPSLPILGTVLSVLIRWARPGARIPMLLLVPVWHLFVLHWLPKRKSKGSLYGDQVLSDRNRKGILMMSNGNPSAH